jgi:DNA-binding transcriptional MerR regulator
VSLEFPTGETEAELDTKSPDAFRTISEVAEDLDIPQHVLRFWETRFAQIKPLKRGGGRRYYRPDDVALLKGIRRLLYGEGYTIKGMQRILKEQGPRHVQAIGRGAEIAPLLGAPVPAETSPAAAVTAARRAAMLPCFEEADGYPGPDEGAAEAHAMPVQTLPVADLALLRATLAELTECRRLLQGALASADSEDA